MKTLIKLQTQLEDKKAVFGQVEPILRKHGYVLCGNWEYDKGKFDGVLWREGGETIYIRLPFTVIEGQLDHPDAFIQFRTPYVIKHVVHVGLDRDENSLLAATGFSQFQEPLDKDGHIKHENQWEDIGQRAVQFVISEIPLHA